MFWSIPSFEYLSLIESQRIYRMSRMAVFISDKLIGFFGSYSSKTHSGPTSIRSSTCLSFR